MEKITVVHLRALAQRLNHVTKSPTEAYTRDGSGKLRANVGNWHVINENGGWNIVRMHNESGGINTPIRYACGPAREVYEAAHAFLRGIDFAQHEMKKD